MAKAFHNLSNKQGTSIPPDRVQGTCSSKLRALAKIRIQIPQQPRQRQNQNILPPEQTRHRKNSITVTQRHTRRSHWQAGSSSPSELWPGRQK